MSHPSLGLPPRSLSAGHPDAAARLRASRAALAVRSLEVAVDADPTIRDRYDDTGLRNLLRDAEVFVDRLALCVAGADAHWLGHFAETSSPAFRRRGVAMVDVIAVLQGLRGAARGVLSTEEMIPAEAALDAAIKVLDRQRRIAGDAGPKNKAVRTIYKGIT